MDTTTKTNAQILRDKIRMATGDKGKLEACERAATRLYDAGQLTANELTQLDAMVMHRLATID